MHALCEMNGFKVYKRILYNELWYVHEGFTDSFINSMNFKDSKVHQNINKSINVSLTGELSNLEK